MPPKKRNFRRPLGERRYRKLFILATEGVKTEPQYFAILNDRYSVIHVDCLRSKHHSSPPQVLKRMQDRLKQVTLDRLLLHFEDGTNIGSSRECSDRLKNHLPDYDKSLDDRKISPDMIEDAIRRAKIRDNPPCEDWPRTLGSTTVYKLVENILSERP